MCHVWIENNFRMPIVYSAPSMSYGTAFERVYKFSALQTTTQLGSKQARVSVACPGGTQSDEARLGECATERCPLARALGHLANAAPALARRGVFGAPWTRSFAMSPGNVLVRGNASPDTVPTRRSQDGRPFAFPSPRTPPGSWSGCLVRKNPRPIDAGSAYFGNTQAMTGKQT